MALDELDAAIINNRWLEVFNKIIKKKTFQEYFGIGNISQIWDRGFYFN